MTTIAEIRQQYPQYDDLSDDQLADAMHRKFYSDMPREEFDQRVGLESKQSRDLRSDLSRMTTGFESGRTDGLARNVDSFMRGAADTMTFGLADEAAALGNATVDAMRGNPNQYDRRLRQERIRQEIRDRDDPVASTAGRVTGALAGGVGLAKVGLSPTANAMARGAGLGKTTLLSAVEGGALGAAHGFGSGEGGLAERVGSAGDGAKYGLVAGAVTPGLMAGLGAGARKLVSPFRTTPERTAAANVLQREGVDLTAGQRTGSRALRYAESEIGGNTAEDVMERQGRQFTAAALRRAGIDADNANSEVIDRGFNEIGRRFDRLAIKHEILPDQKLVRDLRAAFNEYGEMVPEGSRAPIVEKMANDIVGALKRGKISGSAYQSLRSRLDRLARRAAADPELANVLRGYKDALDDGMERYIAVRNPSQLGAWQEVRDQYKNMLVLERAVTGAGENTAQGFISPAQLRGAAVTKQGRRNYARGKGDFAELARAGEAILKPLPQSGTAPRLRAQNLGASLAPMAVGAGAGGAYGYGEGGLPGALAGAAAGFAAPRLVGRAMMSRPGQAFLGNQLLAGQVISPGQQGLLGSAARNTAAGLLGR